MTPCRDLCIASAYMAQMVKNLPVMWETQVRSLGQEDPLEKGQAIHSSIFAWRIPWTKKTGSLQSMKSQNVRHDWETNTFKVHLHSKGSSRDAIKAPGIQRELTMYSYTRLQQCQKKKGKWLSKTIVTKSRENILSLTQGASCIINKIRDYFIYLCF